MCFFYIIFGNYLIWEGEFCAEQGANFIKSFSGPDNITQGARAAEIMCDKFKEMGIDGKAQIVQISGQPGYTTAIERAKGFEDRLPVVCPDVKLLETQPGDWNREKSQQVMEAFLVKYDHIDGVYAGDDNMGVGALNAAKAAGRAKDIIFVGATNFAVGYEAMQAGDYWGSIYQSPIEDAKAALQTAIDILSGKERGPARDIVLLNAAAAIYAADKAPSIEDAIAVAAQSIDFGDASSVLERLVETSNS